eukprot:766527-Hanusia_phi.AAC.5
MVLLPHHERGDGEDIKARKMELMMMEEGGHLALTPQVSFRVMLNKLFFLARFQNLGALPSSMLPYLRPPFMLPPPPCCPTRVLSCCSSESSSSTLTAAADSAAATFNHRPACLSLVYPAFSVP